MASGSARGAPARSRLRRPSRSTDKRYGRSSARVSAARPCAYACRTPTAPATWSSAQRTSRSASAVSRDSSEDRSDTQVQRLAHHHHSRRRGGGQRCGDARRAGARRSRAQSLPPGERRRDDPARGRPANEPHLHAGRLHRCHRLSRRLRLNPSTFSPAVEVRASERARAIVTLGDSVTDGFASTPDMNQRWPNLLAERLQGHPGEGRRSACSTRASAAIVFCMISSARARLPGSIATCSCKQVWIPDRTAR